MVSLVFAGSCECSYVHALVSVCSSFFVYIFNHTHLQIIYHVSDII